MSRQIVGADIAAESSTPLFPLGTLHETSDGDVYMYVQNAASAATAYLTYTYTDGYVIDAALTTTVAGSAKTFPLCIPQIALTASYYGWVFVGPGKPTITTAGAVGADANIYTTATDGKLDDSASGTVVLPGLVCPTAIGSATTGTAVAVNRLFVQS